MLLNDNFYLVINRLIYYRLLYLFFLLYRVRVIFEISREVFYLLIRTEIPC